MNDTNYFDPIYGQTTLPELAGEMLQNNPELIRLRSIGMMNFRSISMLPLTSISRLEHSIGVMHLVTLAARINPRISANLNEFIVAALYHDINCASFGHAIEWAISQYAKYDHEKASTWILRTTSLEGILDKPAYLDQVGLHEHAYAKRFGINLDLVAKIMKGEYTSAIASSGIDLDNIDNVCRMAHYLGIEEAKNLPARLALSLRFDPTRTVPTIGQSDVHLIREWMKTRTKVYHQFIYSKEYMGFEFLLFEMIQSYAEAHGPEYTRSLFHFTDDNLLWTLARRIDEKGSSNVSAIARRLLAHKLPDCIGIIRCDNFDRLSELRRQNFLQTSGFNGSMDHDSIELHVTTDDRKTSRAISLNIAKDNSDEEIITIGEDRSFLLLGVIANKQIPEKRKDSLLTSLTTHLSSKGYAVRREPFAAELPQSQASLF